MFSYFAQRVKAKGKRVLILAHRDELIDQISDTLKQFSVEHSFVAAGRTYNRTHKVHVASVFSAVRRIGKLFPPDLIVVDEAHHAASGSSWSRVLASFPSAMRVGVTATPQRLSGEPLSATFDEIILGPSVRELIDLGALCDYRIYVPSTINVGGLHMRGGDFAKDELSLASDKPSITGDAIKEYKKVADGRRALVFCVSVKHAKHVAEQFAADGYRAACIDGKMDRYIRRDLVNSFRTGGTTILTSCDIISEGFDLPAIEVAIMLRPTQSLALWIQQSGRALRTYPGKEHAIILDHAGNCERHGLPDDVREWSLDGRKKSNQDASKIKVKVCQRCYAAQPLGASACKVCGSPFEVKPREVEYQEGELVELDKEMARREHRRVQGRAGTFEALVELGRKRGYRRPYLWAKHVFGARQARRIGK